jgi:hypothetical protein
MQECICKNNHCNIPYLHFTLIEIFTLLAEIHKLINSIWNKVELPAQQKESIIVPVYREWDKTDY